MGKVFKDGNWILTREGEEPDSNRYTERDDPLYDVLQRIFNGDEEVVDLEKIAASKGLKPEDVFINLHDNYGYICIGTGENPACGETLSDAEKLQRQLDIKRQLEIEKIPHILIKGKYMGVEENSYFIPFNHRMVGLANVLQSDIVRKVEKIAQQHKQDSLLICQNGYACYLYTSGSQKGNVITGRTAVVYPGKSQLPDDCYSLFINSANVGTVGFTCGLDFNRVFSCIEEFAAQENNTLQKHYNDFVTSCVPACINNRKKLVVLMRGTDGYNAYAIQLKQALESVGLKAVVFGTDANIAKVNEEVAADNHNQGLKAGWKWPQILGESLKRNQAIYRSLLASDVDVIIYADMNKLVQFMEPYIFAASEHGYEVVTHVVNSFVFDPKRGDYVKKLCEQSGDYMERHYLDFVRGASEINAKQIQVNSVVIEQFRDLPVQGFSAFLLISLRDSKSAKSLIGGLVPTAFSQSNGNNNNSNLIKSTIKLHIL